MDLDVTNREREESKMASRFLILLRMQLVDILQLKFSVTGSAVTPEHISLSFYCVVLNKSSCRLHLRVLPRLTLQLHTHIHHTPYTHTAHNTHTIHIHHTHTAYNTHTMHTHHTHIIKKQKFRGIQSRVQGLSLFSAEDSMKLVNLF